MGEDYTDTVKAWSDGLGIEYKVITNVDTTDAGFQFQGKKFLRIESLYFKMVHFQNEGLI